MWLLTIDILHFTHRDIGGVTAEEVNSVPLASLLDTTTSEYESRLFTFIAYWKCS